MSDAVDPELASLDDPQLHARYAVGRTLGAGTSGEVALCRDQRIGREVAVKLLRRQAAHDVESKARFVREARVQGALEHPGVVPIYDLSDVERERPWFVMKRVRGITLGEVLEKLASGDAEVSARFTRARLLAAFAQVCRAIDYAHARGVVHRDLSPRNVMLGEFGEVHVLDWGIARIADPEERARSQETDNLTDTRPGQFLGTPGYMAPEQALGDPDVGPEADVYALGSVLFEILAGRALNPGTTTRERLDAAIRGVDARVSVRAPEAGAPPELEKVIASATEARSADRLRSARALADAVEHFLDGDRDVAERARLARELVERASAAKDDAEGRARAARLLSRALAIVPGHEEAATRLSRLLLEPPKEVPPEVRGRLVTWALGSWRTAARAATVRYLFWCGWLPLWFLMGVQEGPLATVLMTVLLAATVLMTLTAMGRIGGFASGVSTYVTSTLAIALFTQVCSPLLVAPTLAATNLIVFCFYARAAHRVAMIACSVAGVAIPIALEATGVIPPTFVVDEQGIHILPRMVAYAPQLTWWLSVFGATITVAVPAIVAGRVRDVLVGAQQNLLLHTWHLEALLPAPEPRPRA